VGEFIIKLCFPPAGIEAIKALGLRQKNPETLRLTTQHGASNYGTGVMLRGKSGEILDGRSFEAMHKNFGAWIECDSADTKRRVGNALACFGNNHNMIRLFCNDNDGKHTITRAQEIA
jgi:hypothetical protein